MQGDFVQEVWPGGALREAGTYQGPQNQLTFAQASALPRTPGVWGPGNSGRSTVTRPAPGPLESV